MGSTFSKRVWKMGTQIGPKLTKSGPKWSWSGRFGQKIMENDRGSKGNVMELVLKPKIKVPNSKIIIFGFRGALGFDTAFFCIF